MRLPKRICLIIEESRQFDLFFGLMSTVGVMIDIAIPGRAPFQLEYAVFDYNGTLALDGHPLPNLRDALFALSERIHIHVITGDTFGRAKMSLSGYPCEVIILEELDQAAAKLRHIEQLGAARCVAIGNGRNDRQMLRNSVLGIAVMQGESLATEALLSADLVAPDILTAVGLLLEPLRLVATLRD